MAHKGIRLLIIDDNDDDLIIISSYLKGCREPLEITSVCTADEAIQKIKDNTYDLCLMDLNLQGMTGLEFFRHIQKNGDKLPVIIITSHQDEKQAEKIMKMGAYNYLPKNELSPTLLNRSIFRAIDENRIRKERERLQEELEAYTERLEEMVEERTKEVEYLNDYKELILSSLEEYIRVVDPEKKTIQYENRKVKGDFGDNIGNKCYALWETGNACEHCISIKAIEELNVQTKVIRTDDRIYSITAIPLRNRDYSLSAIEVISDITAQQKTEEELNHKRRLAAMGEMSAHLAHEIRNPLNKIGLNYHNLLESQDIKGEDKKAVRHIGKGLETLLSIANDLLDYSRSSKLIREDADPVRKIKKVISEVSHEISQKKIKLITNFQGKCPKISVDKTKIRHALTNIIHNAVQSMSDNGTLTVSAGKIENNFFVEVSDTGHGIPKKNLDNIFVPFFTTKKNGTGLGLPIVKNFVELHGGEINIESKVGQGTTVKITLPS